VLPLTNSLTIWNKKFAPLYLINCGFLQQKRENLCNRRAETEIEHDARFINYNQGTSRRTTAQPEAQNLNFRFRPETH
jgi:hypothetical protein